MTIGEARDHFSKSKVRWPPWLYAALFFIPALVAFVLMRFSLEQELLYSGIVALAVMNGSINSVIAYITIKLDDKSSESLQHLEFVNAQMGKLEETLEDANTKVNSFTHDLDEAKEIFGKVGVDLTELDLDSVADVVEKLKENKVGLNTVLDNLRNTDVEEYINQAKRINWKQLLGAAEEIMGFIQARGENQIKAPTTLDTSQIKLEPPVAEEPSLPDDEPELEWTQYAEPDNTSDYTLMGEQEDEPVRSINIPKPTPRLKRDKKLTRDRSLPKLRRD
jgi:hypothetical protein